MIDGKDIREFQEYLRNCTDDQVRGVLEKEKKAGRDAYVALAEAEVFVRFGERVEDPEE